MSENVSYFVVEKSSSSFWAQCDTFDEARREAESLATHDPTSRFDVLRSVGHATTKHVVWVDHD